MIVLGKQEEGTVVFHGLSLKDRKVVAMSGKRHIPTFEEFIKENGIRECAGFWWCGKGVIYPWDDRDYRCVLLARLEDATKHPKQKWPTNSTIELSGRTPRALAKRIREVGFKPPRRIGTLCESARTSPRPN